MIAECDKLIKCALNYEKTNIIRQLRSLLDRKNKNIDEAQFNVISHDCDSSILYFSLLFLLADGEEMGHSYDSRLAIYKAARSWLDNSSGKSKWPGRYEYPDGKLLTGWLSNIYEQYDWEVFLHIIGTNHWKNRVSNELMDRILSQKKYSEAYSLCEIISGEAKDDLVSARVKMVLCASNWLQTHQQITDPWSWALAPAMEDHFIQSGGEECEALYYAVDLILKSDSSTLTVPHQDVLEKIIKRLKRFDYAKGIQYYTDLTADALVAWILHHPNSPSSKTCIAWADDLFSHFGAYSYLFFYARFKVFGESVNVLLNNIRRVKHFEGLENLQNHLEPLLLHSVYDLLAHKLISSQSRNYVKSLFLAEKLTPEHSIHHWLRQRLDDDTFGEGLVAYAMRFNGGKGVESLFEKARSTRVYWSIFYAGNEYIQFIAEDNIEKAIDELGRIPYNHIAADHLTERFFKKEHWLKFIDLIGTFASEHQKDILRYLRKIDGSSEVTQKFVQLTSGLTDTSIKLAAFSLLGAKMREDSNVKQFAHYVEKMQSSTPPLTGTVYQPELEIMIAKSFGGDPSELNEYILHSTEVEEIGYTRLIYCMNFNHSLSSSAYKKIISLALKDPDNFAGAKLEHNIEMLFWNLRMLEEDEDYQNILCKIFSTMKKAKRRQDLYACAAEQFVKTASKEKRNSFLPLILADCIKENHDQGIGLSSAFSRSLVRQWPLEELVYQLENLDTDLEKLLNIPLENFLTILAQALLKMRRYEDCYNYLTRLTNDKYTCLIKLAQLSEDGGGGGALAEYASNWISAEIDLSDQALRIRDEEDYWETKTVKNIWTAIFNLAEIAGNDDLLVRLIRFNIETENIKECIDIAAVITRFAKRCKNPHVLNSLIRAIAMHLWSDDHHMRFTHRAQFAYHVVMNTPASYLDQQVKTMITSIEKRLDFINDERGVASYAVALALFEKGETNLYRSIMNQAVPAIKSSHPTQGGALGIMDLLLNKVSAKNKEKHLIQTVELFGTGNIVSALDEIGLTHKIPDYLDIFGCDQKMKGRYLDIYFKKNVKSEMLLLVLPYLLNNRDKLFHKLWLLVLALFREGRFKEAEWINTQIKVEAKNVSK